MTEEKKENDLIERACRRDESALSELFRANTERLLLSIRAELGDRLRQRLESRDVMQQVYLDALNNIDRFEGRGRDSFFAWIRRIAVNRICDVDRKQFQAVKRAGEVRVADLAGDASALRLFDQLKGSATSPSMAADMADRARALRDALNRLSDDHREVIVLRYINQLNVAATAAKMDRSERAIRSLCARGLIRLRELLGDVI
jgi:RNA polymerase sigma-70 factor, ECF subfamily